jgi:hypothetical protein
MVIVQVLSSSLSRLEAAKISSGPLFSGGLFDSIKQFYGQILCRLLISGFTHAGQIGAI